MRRRAASTSARSGTAMFIRGAAPGPARSGNNAGRAWSGRRSRCTTRTCDSNSHALPEAPSRTRFRFSAAARQLFPARVEDLAVQVYVESDGRVTVRDGEHGAAEGAERVWPGALLPGTADVAVFGVLGFTDPAPVCLHHPGTNHGNVTLPWSGPPRCDIAVVRRGHVEGSTRLLWIVVCRSGVRADVGRQASCGAGADRQWPATAGMTAS